MNLKNYLVSTINTHWIIPRGFSPHNLLGSKRDKQPSECDTSIIFLIFFERKIQASSFPQIDWFRSLTNREIKLGKYSHPLNLWLIHRAVIPARSESKRNTEFKHKSKFSALWRGPIEVQKQEDARRQFEDRGLYELSRIIHSQIEQNKKKSRKIWNVAPKIVAHKKSQNWVSASIKMTSAWLMS